MQEPAIDVRGLHKTYPGEVEAVKAIDFSVAAGEVFGLLGPNGAGKSTFMRILAGLMEPTSGTVRLDDHDVIADPAWLRARLGYLPQEFWFYPHLSGERMLMHLLKLKGVDYLSDYDPLHDPAVLSELAAIRDPRKC